VEGFGHIGLLTTTLINKKVQAIGRRYFGNAEPLGGKELNARALKNGCCPCDDYQLDRKASQMNRHTRTIECPSEALVAFRHTAPPDQPPSERMHGGAKRSGRDRCRTVAREAHGAIDAGSLGRLCDAHHRHDGGKPLVQERLASPPGDLPDQASPVSLCHSISQTSAMSATANASPSTTPPSSTRPVHLHASASTPDITGVPRLAKLCSGSRPVAFSTIFA
jgi:hypothetical protein